MEDRATLGEAGCDLLFRQARTHSAWLDRPVADATLEALWDLLKWGPTSANSLPLRVLFLQSREAKERLRPVLSPGNVDKTMAAPVTAVLAYDTRFYDLLDDPTAPSWFAGPGKEEVALETAFRNSSLQGGYFILAARAVGLDCGPMSGFDKAKLDAEFFPDGRFRSNFLCNLGYGDPTKLPPRNPRLTFAEACTIL